MGRAIDTVGFRLGGGAAFPTAVTVNAGDSLSVRDHREEAGAWLEGVWAVVTNDNVLRIRSPRMHDFVQGMRFRIDSTLSADLLGFHLRQRVYPQDPLTVEGGTGATDVLAGALQIYYEDLGGISARLASWSEIAGRIEHLLAQEVDITCSATPGEWGPGDSITSDFDTLKVNRDYAVIGAEGSEDHATVSLRGSDTGNLRIGVPFSTNNLFAREYFLRTGEATGTPHIPVINSANRGSVLVDGQSLTASATIEVSWLLALLAA